MQVIAAKMAHMIGAHQALPFVNDLLHGERWARLEDRGLHLLFQGRDMYICRGSQLSTTSPSSSL